MFFSAKVLFPVLAAFSVAATAFASPVAAPVGVADIAKRQSADVVNELQSFQSTVTPLIDQLSELLMGMTNFLYLFLIIWCFFSLGQAAATGADKNTALNQLTSAFTDSTKSLKGKKSGIIADVDVVVVVDLAVDIVVVCIVFFCSTFPFLTVLLESLRRNWLSPSPSSPSSTCS